MSDKWESCAEQLPANNFPVLVAYLSETKRKWSVIQARYSGGEWRFLTKRHKSRIQERILYWMSLPEPPK